MNGIKKIRSFGDESPEKHPFRTAKCEYKNGLLSMYYPSDRSYVYRFFGDKDIIYKIEIYNPDGSDAGVSYLEYNHHSNRYYHLPSMDGVGIEIFSEINDPAPQELKREISYTAEMAGNQRIFLLSIEVTYYSGTTYEKIKTDKYPIGCFNSEEGLLSPEPNNRQSAAWENVLINKNRKSTSPGRRFGGEFFDRSGTKYFYYKKYQNH